MVGTTLATVGRWERGQYQPKFDELVKLADVFGVTLDELAGRTEIRPVDPVDQQLAGIHTQVQLLREEALSQALPRGAPMEARAGPGAGGEPELAALIAQAVAQAVAHAVAPLVAQQAETTTRLMSAVDELKKDNQTTRHRYEELVRQMRAGGISNGSYYRSRSASSPDDAEAEGAK